MTSESSRSRASTLQDQTPQVFEFQSRIRALGQVGSKPEQVEVSERISRKAQLAHAIRQSILESPKVQHQKDTFRHSDGFRALIVALEYASQIWTRQEEIPDDQYNPSIRLLHEVFRLLAFVLRDHKGNQKYFRERIEGGGWRQISLMLKSTLFREETFATVQYWDLLEEVFGCLLACALDDEPKTGFFTRFRQMLNGSQEFPNAPDSGRKHSRASPNPSGAIVNHTTDSTDVLATVFRNEYHSSPVIHNEDAIFVLFELWRFQGDISRPPNIPRDKCRAIEAVPNVINHLARFSTSNLVALHGSSLLGSVIASLLSVSNAKADSASELRALAATLLQLGISDLQDARLLYRNVPRSPLIAELVLESLKSSRSPPYVHFDLSLHGFASVELPGIGRAFPPTASCAGYTLSLWFQITHFDPNTHTTIFGAFDASQTCFVLVYLEKDTHNCILQTSVSSSRPSVRFNSVSFTKERWYHVVITHRRPRSTSSSRASLFVDGEFVESVKSQYPATAPSAKENDIGVSSPSSNGRSSAIQAFLGTPQDLASQLGRGKVHTQWRLASANLFAGVLSDDLVAVYFELGPRYTGNYQDCLGSFQTYRASAALNLRNESLHPGKEEKSDILTAIRSKAGTLLPESNVLLNISATMILDDDDRNNINETHLLNLLSKAAGRNLRNVTRGGRNALAINGAMPAINEALLHPSGFAVLTGDPTVVVPQSLDDATWRIAGCAAVGLALLEAADRSDDILRALKILFESVQGNWRNSEAMERENGFGILSVILSAKLGQQTLDATENHNATSIALTQKQQSSPPLALQVLTELLKFVGYSTDRPENSVINNPLAYRTLLVDMEFWRITEPVVQKLYYEQFIVFGVRSKYHLFNMKRLARMRITKKWLDALKSETFSPQTFDYFLESFKVILTNSLSADAMRSLALYITYAIHKPKQKPSTPVRGKSIKVNTDVPYRRKTLGSFSPRPMVQQGNIISHLSQLQVALRILELYTGLLCQRDSVANISKFARTVTNKWLLHLLADDEPTVVILATKILARLLVVSGPRYVQKFVHKTGGVVIMRHRLKRWWNVPTIWPICFAILFGLDVSNVDFSRSFELFSLLEIFASGGEATVAYPVVLPVITAMLGEGLKTVTRNQSDPDSPSVEKNNGKSTATPKGPATPTQIRHRSMTLNIDSSVSKNPKYSAALLTESVSTLRTITRFLADLHAKSPAFRDFTANSSYIQELFLVLFPVVVSADPVSPDMELHSRDSTLTFKGGDVIMRPLSVNSMSRVPIVRTSTVESTQAISTTRAPAPKRMSSYILVSSDLSQPGSSKRRPWPAFSPDASKAALNLSSTIVEELLELTIAVFCDQIFSRKDFPGLGLFMKVPPGFQEHQAYFETFILRNTISQLGNAIKLDQKLLWEPRVLTNLARFVGHLGESIYEGWFISGAEDTLEFLANVLEYLQLPSIASIKAIRLCSQTIENMRSVLLRVVLLRLSELDEITSVNETLAFLNRLVYWQIVLVPVEDSQQPFLKLLCFLIYNRLVSSDENVRIVAANLWRILLVQKPHKISKILQQASNPAPSSLTKGFKTIIELDNELFLSWVDDHRDELDNVLFAPLSKSWKVFVAEENHRTEETAGARINKRREKLKLWVSENLADEEVLRRHEIGTDHWRSNIYAAEHLKMQRTLQDLQDDRAFTITTWAKMSRGLHRQCGLFDDETTLKWQLDQTEGRNRMRMRLVPDKDAHLHDYQPKRRQSQGPGRNRRSVSTHKKLFVDDVPPLPNRSIIGHAAPATRSGSTPLDVPFSGPQNGDADEDVEEDFEIVDGPLNDPEEYEDKNRKVMRSLQRGDQVEHVHNISRIVGLEAIEGLLILGKGYLYLLDDLFQRTDGEVVNAFQAPQEERDPYLQMISGREAGARTSSSKRADYETRNWRWDDVLSISKRRFLFRDVAIEVFFVDGRSYLLTTSNPSLRDELYQKLLSKALAVGDRVASATGEDAWRIDAVRIPGDETQTLGSKFSSVFAQSHSHPATRRWLRGEISNFHYLMLINTMAGRTFNDLTQYPVFPWVLADYTSQTLDLSNPRTFRDLSKPMGCQTAQRGAEFRDRYQSFAEMGDANSPPFHYGTHYSSAMIVASYLIRLQPFVHSYLLLQGGSFDHPDRLFYSVENAWSSASRDNMTDVRELVPEFYYLPEFLVNQNRYDFGTRQGNGGTVDNVTLPPWANGDPKIFIAKHREALESDYVSQHLHQWIDLVFGHKQRGEAALEATNVFHHLSYHGAKDLDTIDDPVERLATIGIIHNFGQTPHQIFQRPHLAREEGKYKVKRLDTAAKSLTRLPFPITESDDRVTSLHYSSKNERLLCSGPFRLNIGLTYDKYMEWGFVDGSVRFFAADSRKLIGLFEHIHQGQLSCVLFADSKTLVTAGSDCTISIWTVVTIAESVDLQPKTCLFGHGSAVTILAVSRSFSTLLSASSDGQVLLWDLNRFELVRQLTTERPVECARINDVTGAILLCRGSDISLRTLNGDSILEQNIQVEGDDSISSCAFYEGSGNEYLERDLIFTGHKKGVVNVWNVSITEGAFSLEHVKRMHHLDAAGYNIGATITSILPMAQKVYTGDDSGRVYEWDCIQRQ